MMRLLACSLCVFLATVALAEDELPKDPETSFDVEPPLLIQEQPNQRGLRAGSESAPERESDPERIEAALEKAKRSAAAGERLFRSGVIAKVEAENRALEVVRLQADLANAQLERATAGVASQQARLEAGEITPDELERARSELAQATAAAQAASANRDRAEMDAALVNLQRQKKLLALGSGRKSDVNRAAEKVTALQQPKE
jgi:outer membrane protein TolC